MLTTNQIVQNAASLLWPSMLILVAWYSIAAALRAFVEFTYRWYHRKRVSHKVKQVASPLEKQDLQDLQSMLEESLLIGRGATKMKIYMALIEGILFSALAVAAFYGAQPLVQFNQHWLILHSVGVIFFLCFILRARRILLLIPLTFVVWVSWEMFLFITNFENTLKKTSLMATVEILEKKKTPTGYKAKIAVKFQGQQQPMIINDLPVQNELFFKGRVYRVDPEVLLFGGKNIAYIDQVFSDDMKSKNARSFISTEEKIPPLYQWKNYQKNFQSFLHKKMFYLLWKQFFKLKNTRFVKEKLLEAPRCAPVEVGRVFEIRLRHVGGLECHLKRREPPRLAPPHDNNNTSLPHSTFAAPVQKRKKVSNPPPSQRQPAAIPTQQNYLLLPSK